MIAMVSVALAPVFGIFSIFLFVLLIIVLVKKPKVGAFLVSAIVLIPLAALALNRMPRLHPPVMPVVGIGGIFVFVLLIIMLHRTPRAAVGLIVAIVIVLGTMWLTPGHLAHQQPATIRQQTQSNYVPPNPEVIYEDFRQIDAPSSHNIQLGSADVSYVDTSQPTVTAPIWSEGVDDQYEADIYPSKKAAVSALGPKLKDWVREVVTEANEPIKIVLFQEDHNRSVVWRFERSLEEAIPGVTCSIESGSRNIDLNEIGMTLRFEVDTSQTPSWENHSPILQENVRPMILMDSGRAVAKARCRERETTVTQSFSEKPWADDFSAFVNERPDRHFLVARSRSACTSENEAKRQAEADACEQLSLRLADAFPKSFPGPEIPGVTLADLQEDGFVVDQFVQSFDGLSGRLWRQALLIEVSRSKMARLERDKRIGMRVERMTWAHMILSSIGALAIIVVSYLFLNMATRGYYVWSLRIAGVVLAIAGIVSIILILR